MPIITESANKAPVMTKDISMGVRAQMPERGASTDSSTDAEVCVVMFHVPAIFKAYIPIYVLESTLLILCRTKPQA